MQNKIKVAFVTQFSNTKVRSCLHLKDFYFENFIRELLRHKPFTYYDFAPWVSHFIGGFEGVDDIEIHIISPHVGMKKKFQEFTVKGVFYHFVKCDEFSLVRGLKNLFHIYEKTNYKKNRKAINRIINNINPEVVCLCGAENAYFSSSILDIYNKPIFVLLQTILNNPRLMEFGVGNEHARYIEREIFKKAQYIGTNGALYYSLVKDIAPHSLMLRIGFPRNAPADICVPQKKDYDFVFYAARVVKNKGVEDTIEALNIVCKLYPQVTLNIVGGCSDEYKNVLMEKIVAYGLSQNVIFHGYFPKHEDVFKQVVKSRVVVVPGITAVLNSTVTEPMFLGMPVITYETSGTPILNKEKKCVLLATIGDIEGLASQMIYSLEHPSEMEQLGRNGKERVNRLFNNESINNLLLDDFRAIYRHYYKGEPISDNLILKF